MKNIDTIKKHIQEEMSLLTKSVNDTPEILNKIAKNLYPHLEDSLKKENYITYIIFGSEIIEYILKKMILVHEHAINLTMMFASGMSDSDYQYLLSGKHERRTGKQVLEYLDNNFSFKKHHYDEYMLCNQLFEKRNEIVHQLIEKYSGNINDVNISLLDYVKTMPVENIMEKILHIQKEISEDLTQKDKILKTKIK